MSYFVGLDVSLRSVSVCIIDQEGLIVLEQSVDCEAETIISVFTVLKTKLPRLALKLAS